MQNEKALNWINKSIELDPDKARNAQVVRPIYQDSVKLWKRYENYLEPLISTLNG